MRLTLQTWVSDSVAQMEERVAEFSSAHVDDLDLVVDDLLDAGRVLELVAGRVPGSWKGRVSLALPLDESPTLQTRVPPLSTFPRSLDEPPSIYLMSAAHFLGRPIDGEEYRARATLPGMGENLAAEFVSYRDDAAAALGWGYVNTLWIHRLRST